LLCIWTSAGRCCGRGSDYAKARRETRATSGVRGVVSGWLRRAVASGGGAEGRQDEPRGAPVSGGVNCGGRLEGGEGRLPAGGVGRKGPPGASRRGGGAGGKRGVGAGSTRQPGSRGGWGGVAGGRGPWGEAAGNLVRGPRWVRGANKPGAWWGCALLGEGLATLRPGKGTRPWALRARRLGGPLRVVGSAGRASRLVRAHAGSGWGSIGGLAGETRCDERAGGAGASWGRGCSHVSTATRAAWGPGGRAWVGGERYRGGDREHRAQVGRARGGPHRRGGDGLRGRTTSGGD